MRYFWFFKLLKNTFPWYDVRLWRVTISYQIDHEYHTLDEKLHIMLSVTVYTCMAIGFILLIANILVFYAVLKKKQYSTVDHLVGAICIHGQLYYVLASLVALAIYYLPKKLNNSRAFLDYFQDWVACYFGLSFTTLLTMFYVDRYLATARPLFYKMKVRNRFGRIAIAISVCAALLLASLLVIVQFFSSHLVRARHSFFVCLNTFTFVCFIGMLLSYTLICRSLLYFAGRQMYISVSYTHLTLPTILLV